MGGGEGELGHLSTGYEFRVGCSSRGIWPPEIDAFAGCAKHELSGTIRREEADQGAKSRVDELGDNASLVHIDDIDRVHGTTIEGLGMITAAENGAFHGVGWVEERARRWSPARAVGVHDLARGAERALSNVWRVVGAQPQQRAPNSKAPVKS